MPVITVAPNNDLLEKLKSNLQEVRARGGELYVFADPEAGIAVVGRRARHPDAAARELFPGAGGLHRAAAAARLPLAILRGTDVDQPRNLAKIRDGGVTRCPLSRMSRPPGRALPAPTLISYTHWMYGLHAFSAAIGVLTSAIYRRPFPVRGPSIIAVIMNYLKRDEARGTWLESHFNWQLRTFWFAALWVVLVWALSLPFIPCFSAW